MVHADETGWREDGHNGYVRTFSTPNQRCFLRRGRGKAVVDEALGSDFAGVLVSDFYATYHHYDCPKQSASGGLGHPCSSQGQALLRDIHPPQADGRFIPRMSHGRGGLMRSTMSMPRPKPFPTRRSNNGAWLDRPWNIACWLDGALTWTTRISPGQTVPTHQ